LSLNPNHRVTIFLEIVSRLLLDETLTCSVLLQDVVWPFGYDRMSRLRISHHGLSTIATPTYHLLAILPRNDLLLKDFGQVLAIVKVSNIGRTFRLGLAKAYLIRAKLITELTIGALLAAAQ